MIIVTGVGGTGVITIGALLGMAAHLESKGCSVLDQTGLAQKGGAVVSHVRIAARPGDVTTTRLATAPTGDAIATNLFMLGHAWQKGHIPLTRAAIERASRASASARSSMLATFPCRGPPSSGPSRSTASRWR